MATTAAMPNALGASRTRSAPRLAGTGPVARLQSILKSLLDPYRPELYYMRGPGPKWREKNGDTASA